MKKVMLIVTVLCLGFLTACAENVSINTYDADSVGVASKVESGIIIDKRKVKLDTSNKLGGTAGAIAGAAGGSAIGGDVRSNVVGAVGGAVLGGAIGDVADKAINTRKGFEYVIKLTKDGSVIAIAQASDVQLEINQRVLIIYGAMTRIIPDNTSTAQG